MRAREGVLQRGVGRSGVLPLEGARRALGHHHALVDHDQPVGEGVGVVQAEPGLPRAVVRELEKRGHVVKRVPRNGGGYQGIWIDPATNVLHGGSEHRKDGMAVGY